MLKIRYHLFAFFCVVIFSQAKATHNRAGEITYKWLYGFTYQVKVTTYTNLTNSGGGSPADRCEDTVYFGDGTRAVVLRSNGSNNGSCAPAGEGVPLPGNTIKLNEYVTTHTYPGPGSYKISMEDPNRNAGVINISNSVSQLFYIESFLVIPAFGNNKNNSPILTFPPVDNGCLSKCFYHNPGAYDSDGDSLSYELTTSRGHLGITCPGYTFPATGGGYFLVDSLTGTLKWCNPQIQGEYNLAMIIKEWRRNDDGDYFLIGYILRDMQIIVGPCSNNNPLLNSVSDTCVLAGSLISKTIRATDPDADILTMEAFGAPFSVTSPIATFYSPVSLTPVTGQFTWQTKFNHVRKEPYQVTIKVKDNDPMVSLVDFKTFNIRVIPDPPLNLSTASSNDNILLTWKKPAHYSLSGPVTFFKYQVYRMTGLSSWAHSSTETVPPVYTGFTYLGGNQGINDTLFYDYNNATPFISGQPYSYVVLAEYSDGSSSYVSNIAADIVVVGIEEHVLTGSDIQVYPNPVSDNLALLFNQNNHELFTIELTDVTGRKLKTLTSREYITKENTIHLNLENINPGVYFLKIIDTAHTSITKKIIKQ